MPGCSTEVFYYHILVCVSGLFLFKSEPGRRSSSASTHANGTETNDSGKMSAERRDGVSEGANLCELSNLTDR